MKYRSPSPESDVALPTPPQSPRTLEVNRSAANTLETLAAFYQQEQYWIHHTRASLELALTRGIDAPPSSVIASTSATPDGAATDTASTAAGPAIKVEPDTASIPLVDSPSSTRPEVSLNDLSARASRWVRRKNQMKLKIDGISTHAKRHRPARAPATEPGARLLEMFSELVDARMESCQRISRLIQQSERPQYCSY